MEIREALGDEVLGGRSIRSLRRALAPAGWGLLLQFAVVPGIHGQAIPRQRPHLNAARTTFVGDNGRLLRGPYTSTEWTAAVPEAEIANMRNLGFNAVHLYAEVFDPDYPNPGSTAPGYNAAEVDKIVQRTRDQGMYLVMTLGNGANNGNYNYPWVMDFWRFYAPRYAAETHVLYEIHNEPVAWGPPYSSATATPTGAVGMNIDAYRIIRARAPDTPVLLFSYAVLGDTGGANAALTDIRAFNTAVFGTEHAVWTREAVGFHGYAGAEANATAVASLLGAGYPCLMTEFATGTWGGDHGGLDVEAVANLERLGVSWLTFQFIPPWGVSDSITRPDAFKDRVDNSGLSWTPDYGDWPVARGVFGNGGRPWTTPGYVNNTLRGTRRIEAEDFDEGGKGIAYFNGNPANPGGLYRVDETVGIGPTADGSGGYAVGWTAAGDWLEYTMKVSAAGTYALRLRVAGTQGGRVQVFGYGEDLTGEWILPATGSDHTWTTVSQSVFLRPGQQILRIQIREGGFHLDWIEFSAASAGPLADGTVKILNAASARALDVDAGNRVVVGEYTGVANQHWTLQHVGGGQYRINSVGIGESWTTFAGPLHLGPWWGASGDRCFVLLPTGDGFCRIFSAGGGRSLQPSRGDAPRLEEATYTGTAEQQWALLPPSVPAFPTGLQAEEVGSTAAVLRWEAVAGAASYRVKRSVTRGGPYSTIASGITATTYTDSGLSPDVQYYYVVSAVAGGEEGPDGAMAVLRSAKLTGSIIGTPGSWNNSGNTIARVFDNNLNTFFDGPNSSDGNGCWVGLDCGADARNIILQIRYCPRAGFASRMVGGVFQGANQADFRDAVSLYTVGAAPPEGAFTTATITSAAGFRYVRFLSPDDGWGNVAELEFHGYPFSMPVPVPEGLSARAESGSRIHLSWNATPGATGYNLKRAGVSGGPYDTLASGVETTSYLDTDVLEGSSYCYVVSAVTASGESPDSAEVFVMPYPWSTQDIGLAGLAGGVSAAGGTFTVTASGADIWDTADAFRYVYTEVAGDCALVARVTSVEDTDPWAKGGIMIRQGLEPGAANAMICVTPGNGVSFQWRAAAGAVSDFSNTPGLDAPHWIRLVRRGNTFAAYRSADGRSWTRQGAMQSITMERSVLVGLAVTAHNDGRLCPAGFDRLSGFVMPPAPPLGLQAVAVSAGQIDLAWTASPGATSHTVKRATSSGGSYSTIASNVVATRYSDVSGLSAGTRYFYVISAVNAGGESGHSREVEAVPSAVIAPEEYAIAHHSAGGATLALTAAQSVPGHVYQIWASDHLVSPDWQPVGSAQGGSGEDLIFAIPLHDLPPHRYFTLDVQRQ